jgi:hypothetical protein
MDVQPVFAPVLPMLIPLLISLVSLGAGIMGLLRSRQLPSRKGRGASIFGIVTGAICTISWAAVAALTLSSF